MSLIKDACVSKEHKGLFRLNSKNANISTTRRGRGKSVYRGRYGGARGRPHEPCESPRSPPSSLARVEGAHFTACESHLHKGESEKAVGVSRAPTLPQRLEKQKHQGLSPGGSLLCGVAGTRFPYEVRPPPPRPAAMLSQRLHPLAPGGRVLANLGAWPWRRSRNVPGTLQSLPGHPTHWGKPTATSSQSLGAND